MIMMLREQELVNKGREEGLEKGIGIGREEGLEKGIGIGREEGIGIGREETAQRYNRLITRLLAEKRVEDLARAAADPEVLEQLYREFGI